VQENQQNHQQNAQQKVVSAKENYKKKTTLYARFLYKLKIFA
jgi:hypothetical protein